MAFKAEVEPGISERYKDCVCRAPSKNGPVLCDEHDYLYSTCGLGQFTDSEGDGRLAVFRVCMIWRVFETHNYVNVSSKN